ncbi:MULTISPECIES: hypothetical protein [Chryseobacterium]|uniref:Killing trait domain-containing protein n=1 Tax=Chryseobacterium geocarposphaerae TaxID=1416776 RepID=A0ABU1L942_9FLAO|nr:MULTISPECIES: hypothetical protein [Chryseobacterium]MDR6403223.1 hypothetical protein [Chryseobacterium geocarposphaerae]MDR6696777.1 hypothetical protein [Chryseobacterium ginsenosidimutans]
MDENSNEKTETTAPTASNSAEKSVQFVNAEVLSPPTASPMGGVAKVMIEQSAGMMVQDLQSFLKGFEQVGLIALSRLANNFLTYGTPSGPKSKSSSSSSSSSSAAVEDEAQVQDTGNGNNDMMKDLFKMVSDYAEVKAKISNTIYNATPLHPIPGGIQNSSLFTDVSAHAEDPEKKK